MRISDWSSDVCSSDLADAVDAVDLGDGADQQAQVGHFSLTVRPAIRVDVLAEQVDLAHALSGELGDFHQHVLERPADFLAAGVGHHAERWEAHTSELQSQMRISYAVFSLKQIKTQHQEI